MPPAEPAGAVARRAARSAQPRRGHAPAFDLSGGAGAASGAASGRGKAYPGAGAVTAASGARRRTPLWTFAAHHLRSLHATVTSGARRGRRRRRSRGRGEGTRRQARPGKSCPAGTAAWANSTERGRHRGVPHAPTGRRQGSRGEASGGSAGSVRRGAGRTGGERAGRREGRKSRIRRALGTLRIGRAARSGGAARRGRRTVVRPAAPERDARNELARKLREGACRTFRPQGKRPGATFT